MTPSEPLRLSDLIGATVTEAGGTARGVVTDVRLAQIGPVDGALAQLRVESLIVSARHTGSLFGYERGATRGPWIVRAVVQWLHRDAVLLPFADVADIDTGTRTIRCR